MPEKYSVEPFSKEKLFEALSNKYCDAGEMARQDRAIFLYGYLDKIGAKTIVVEYDYTDGDYLEDFASYYVRCFQNYQRRCKRVHFFGIEFEVGHFKKLITNSEGGIFGDLENSYLGFVVARPLPSAIVGRTILKTYDSDSGRRHYTAIKEYEANLFGNPLKVKSLAFQEQDTVLAACATVALWSAFHKTAELFESLSPRPAVITRIANGVTGASRAIPSHGLDVKQMVHAVRSVGLEPELISARPAVPLLSLAYAYLHMGIPVILGAEIENRGLHALTLVGYSLKQTQVNQQEVASGEKSIRMAGLRIDEFYAHDDQIGPFAHIKVKPSGRNFPVEFEGDWKETQTGKVLSLFPVFLLVPVYNKIRVTFIGVTKYLTRMTALLSILSLMPIDYEWDLRLTTTNKLKTDIKGESLPSSDLERILMAQQPRFIWRATLRFDGKPFVELLADATDMERSFPVYEQVWYDKGIQVGFKAILRDPRVSANAIDILQKRFYDFLIG